LEDNLNFIADTLGCKRYETSRQAIRRYFVQDFYKDYVHLYRKRPVYWLFDSGNNDGFKALIYIHRCNETTIARLRTEYLHILQRKYEAEIAYLDRQHNLDGAARKNREKLVQQLDECLQYDQAIHYLANKRMTLDLDEGVRANYLKFQGIEINQAGGKKVVTNILAPIIF
jgi:hypothetical protein